MCGCTARRERERYFYTRRWTAAGLTLLRLMLLMLLGLLELGLPAVTLLRQKAAALCGYVGVWMEEIKLSQFQIIVTSRF